MSTGHLFFPPPTSRTATTADGGAAADRRGGEPDRARRARVFRSDAGRWVAWVPAWRPESFEDDGRTPRAPYGWQEFDSREQASAHVEAYLRSGEALADREEMLRLLRIGGDAYVRPLPNAAAYAGRVRLQDVLDASPWRPRH